MLIVPRAVHNAVDQALPVIECVNKGESGGIVLPALSLGAGHSIHPGGMVEVSGLRSLSNT